MGISLEEAIETRSAGLLELSVEAIGRKGRGGEEVIFTLGDSEFTPEDLIENPKLRDSLARTIVILQNGRQ